MRLLLGLRKHSVNNSHDNGSLTPHVKIVVKISMVVNYTLVSKVGCRMSKVYLRSYVSLLNSAQRLR